MMAELNWTDGAYQISSHDFFRSRTPFEGFEQWVFVRPFYCFCWQCHPVRGE